MTTHQYLLLLKRRMTARLEREVRLPKICSSYDALHMGFPTWTLPQGDCA